MVQASHRFSADARGGLADWRRPLRSERGCVGNQAAPTLSGARKHKPDSRFATTYLERFLMISARRGIGARNALGTPGLFAVRRRGAVPAIFSGRVSVWSETPSPAVTRIDFDKPSVRFMAPTIIGNIEVRFSRAVTCRGELNILDVNAVVQIR